ncbi:MAG: SGNH/GDSL hydrolase family protein, partial [Myxococcota bacterium]
MSRERRKLAGNLAVLALSFSLALALAEGVLQLAWDGRPQFYRPDPVRGASHRPGARGWYSYEGRGWVEINSAGLRDREHALAKPAGTLRIAVLGDSYAEAMQVDREATFWAVAERELAQCPALAGRAVEAINFGVSSYGTSQQLETLRHFVWDYDPDVEVVAFLTGNDYRNNVRELER